MERELACTTQEFEFCPQRSCGSPLSELSDFSQSAQTRNELQCNKHVKHMKEGQISRIMQICCAFELKLTSDYYSLFLTNSLTVVIDFEFQCELHLLFQLYIFEG